MERTPATAAGAATARTADVPAKGRPVPCPAVPGAVQDCASTTEEHRPVADVWGIRVLIPSSTSFVLSQAR